MSEKLEKCPFCGGDPEVVTRDVEPQGDPWYGDKTETFVLCSCGACLFDGEFHDGFGPHDGAKADAIAAWNRRALERASQSGGVEADRRDAERWREAVRYIGARYGEDGRPVFHVSRLLGISENIMKGSVAEHFTNAIDRSIVIRADRAAPSAGNGGAEGV